MTCPFTCTYCAWGDDWLRASNRFSIERVIAEIDYIANKFKKKKEFNGYLYLADSNFGMHKRDLEIAIEAVILGGDDFDQKLDNIAEQIESALDGFEIETRKADLIKLKSTEIDYSIEGSKIYGAVRLIYSVIYRTDVKQPDNIGTPITEIESNL